MKTTEEQNGKLCQLTDEELSQVSGGSGDGFVIFEFDYLPLIKVYYYSSGLYVLRNILTNEERSCESASDFDDIAHELGGY